MKNKAFCKRLFSFFLIALMVASFLAMPSVHVYAHVEEFGVGTSDYEEYRRFMEEWEVDSRFVRYETFQALGAFKNFVSSDGAEGHQTPFDYLYDVVDENGYPLIITFDRQKQNAYRQERRTVLSTAKDMLTVNSTESFEIVRGPLHYRYGYGELAYICWVLGDVRIELRQDPSIDMPDYPMDGENTIYRRLLSRNYLVALAAYYELIWDMPLQPGETRFSRIQYIIWPVVVLILLIAACIATICIFRRIRRKKRTVVDHSALQKETTETDYD